MKKFLISTVVALGLASTLSAEQGTIKSMMFAPDGVQIILNSGGTDIWSPINTASLTGDALKNFIAAALTAQSTGATVDLVWQNGGWIAVRIISN